MIKGRYRTQIFHQQWMKFAAIVVMSFGPLFLIGSYLPTAEPTRLMMELFGWTLGDGQSFDHPTTRFVSALAGGFLIGWGVLIWLLSGGIFEAAPNGVRKAMIVSFLLWFVTDSLASVASGHPPNAGFNLFFLLLCIGPMWLPATDTREFSARTT